MNTAQNTIQIDATVQWRYFREPEAGRFVGDCDALGLTIEGRTHQELIDYIIRGQNMMFRCLLESGELAQFLENHHWKMYGSPIASLAKDTRFDLPFDLVRDKANDSAYQPH